MTVELTCERCGTLFQVPTAWTRRKSPRRFCTADCYYAHQREKPNGREGSNPTPRVERECAQCGKTFKTSAKRPRQTCSRECMSALRRVTKTCVRCGATFTVPRSNAARYNHCTAECANADLTLAPCKVCGRIFNTKRGALAHCSEECRRPPENIECPVCGETFRGVPSDRRRFCSTRCYRRHTGETEPETNMRLALETLGRDFIQEYAVPGWKGPIDFYLTDTRVGVEVDEPYWHARTRDRDARKDAFMQGRGIAVLRLDATPFYGPLTEGMVDAVSAALQVAENAVAATNAASLHPLQLAVPLDKDGVV